MTGVELKQLHVLLLGRVEGGDEIARWFAGHASVERVDSFEQALQALRSEPFDVIISRAADFIPFHEIHFTRQTDSVLDTVSQGVCIVGRDGTIEWANPRMLAFSDEVRKRVCRCCVETFQWAEQAVGSGAEQLRGRRFRISAASNASFEVTATPVIDLERHVTRVAAVLWDTLGGQRLQYRIDAIDRAGRELLSLEVRQFARLDTKERLARLDERIRAGVRELLQFESFEIFVLDRGTGSLVPVLSSGIPADRIAVELSATGDGNGICGYVAAHARSYICPDTANDARYLPGIDHARSSLTVPLILHEEVVGVANFESTTLSEGQTATGRFSSDVLVEINGPLNDIVTEVENLIEDYIGHDDLRHRLRTISENSVRIRDRIKDLAERKPCVVGSASKPEPGDPVLEGKRVLLVDDEEIIRETVRDVLSGCGCRVTAVENGLRAVELLGREPFDLVLSDIKLPGKNGYEVFATAKQANAAVPVILMTGFGYDPNHAIVRAHREGLSAVLFKPFKVDQLVGEVRTALESVTQP
jgi:CheY-like chemotaxis protein/PAS domain-containing protein